MSYMPRNALFFASNRWWYVVFFWFWQHQTHEMLVFCCRLKFFQASLISECTGEQHGAVGRQILHVWKNMLWINEGQSIDAHTGLLKMYSNVWECSYVPYIPARIDLIYGALQSHYCNMGIFHGGCKLPINIMDPFIRPWWRFTGWSFSSAILVSVLVKLRSKWKYLDSYCIYCHGICAMHICVPQRMNLDDFCLAPPWVWHLCLGVRFLYKYWMDCREIYSLVSLVLLNVTEWVKQTRWNRPIGLHKKYLT